MSIKALFASFVLCAVATLLGCNGKGENWNAQVISKVENPRNGYANFTSQRAEVIADQCGLLRRSCVSVRLLDETGFANANGGRFFTYKGNSAVSVVWADPLTLNVSCSTCDTSRVQRQLAKVNLVTIKYMLRRSQS